MSTATLDAPQAQNGSAKIERESVARDRRARARSGKLKSTVPADASSTPKALVPPQNEVAVRTPKEIDFDAVIKGIMFSAGKAGGGYGDRFATKKGNQHVFALGCTAIASMLGKDDLVPFKGPDGVERYRLPDELANKVKASITSVLLEQSNRFLNYGSDAATQGEVIWTWDKPNVKHIAAAKSGLKNADGKELEDLDLGWKATAKATRMSQSLGEQVLCAHQYRDALLKRQANMDKRPGEYTAEQKREVQHLIDLSTWKLGHLERRKVQEAKREVALNVLRNDLQAGKVTAEQFAEFEAKIVNEPVVC